MAQVESFSLDHTKVKAPYVRKAGIYTGPKGDKVSKFDLRFMQPNKEFMNTAGMHALEHLMATYMRDYLDDIIDLSPMGCRTGFYLLMMGEYNSSEILPLLERTFQFIVEFEGDIPGATAKDCGNYQDMNLEMAKYHSDKYLKLLKSIPEDRLNYPE